MGDRIHPAISFIFLVYKMDWDWTKLMVRCRFRLAHALTAFSVCVSLVSTFRMEKFGLGPLCGRSPERTGRSSLSRAVNDCLCQLPLREMARGEIICADYCLCRRAD